jgi:hypothetical protein
MYISGVLMKKAIILFVILGFFATGITSLWAQNVEQSKVPLTGQTKFSSYSLLDPSKMDLHHSYSFAYFSNSQGSFGLGIYTAVLDYRISSPLSLRLGLSYLHQPLGRLNNKTNLNIKQSILPSFELRYEPNERTFISLGFSTSNPYFFQTE